MESTNVPPPNHLRVLDGGQGWIGLLDHMGNESTITNAARVSFGKMKREFDESDERLMKYLIDNKHMTPLEHVVFTFIVHCPLFVRSQWHRHRTWSYNEISRRYTDVDIEFYVPDSFRIQSSSNKQGSVDGSVVEGNESARKIYETEVSGCLSAYEHLIEMGVCKEQARGILPQNLMTTFWATVDLNNLLKFIELRDDDHAQKEIREYAVAIKRLIAPHVPHVMEYFESRR